MPLFFKIFLFLLVMQNFLLQFILYCIINNFSQHLKLVGFSILLNNLFHRSLKNADKPRFLKRFIRFIFLNEICIFVKIKKSPEFKNELFEHEFCVNCHFNLRGELLE